MGRLRAALPGLARDLVVRTDDELLRVPALAHLDDRRLLAVIERASRALVALHGHEVLIGLLSDPGDSGPTGTAVALRALAAVRGGDEPRAEVAARHPVVLAVVPPRVQPSPPLPDDVEPPPGPPPPGGDEAAVLREALRLRVRWVQELGGRAAWELGERLAARAILQAPEEVRFLRLAGLRSLVTGRAALWHVRRAHPEDVTPLPARFRLTDRDVPVAVTEQAGAGAGEGAGGGSGKGPVHQGEGTPPEGSVLVVPTLNPGLGAVLPRLGGLVAETGSPLAHLAILARESGVPTVVGVVGARERFRPGTVIRVDGTSGDVEVVGGERG